MLFWARSALCIGLVAAAAFRVGADGVVEAVDQGARQLAEQAGRTCLRSDACLRIGAAALVGAAPPAEAGRAAAAPPPRPAAVIAHAPRRPAVTPPGG